MKYLLALFGLLFTFLLIKYRESIGDSLGNQNWMKYVGGVYNLVVIVAVLIFFWSIATLTGTERIFLTPILMLIPGALDQPADPASNGLLY